MSTKRRHREIEYDYENFYDTPIDSLKDKYIEELLRTNKIDHHYTTKTIKSGNQFEVEIYPTSIRRILKIINLLENHRKKLKRT